MSERTGDYGMVLPDTITLYRRCIAEVCDTPEETLVKKELKPTGVETLPEALKNAGLIEGLWPAILLSDIVALTLKKHPIRTFQKSSLRLGGDD